MAFGHLAQLGYRLYYSLEGRIATQLDICAPCFTQIPRIVASSGHFLESGQKPIPYLTPPYLHFPVVRYPAH